jgi:hypothetical protein
MLTQESCCSRALCKNSFAFANGGFTKLYCRHLQFEFKASHAQVESHVDGHGSNNSSPSGTNKDFIWCINFDGVFAP